MRADLIFQHNKLGLYAFFFEFFPYSFVCPVSFQQAKTNTKSDKKSSSKEIVYRPERKFWLFRNSMTLHKFIEGFPELHFSRSLRK